MMLCLDMGRLIGVQSQVVYRVVAWVSVNVMDNLGRLEVASEVLLHNQTVLKNVLGARLQPCTYSMRMALWRNN